MSIIYTSRQVDTSIALVLHTACYIYIYICLFISTNYLGVEGIKEALQTVVILPDGGRLLIDGLSV